MTRTGITIRFMVREKASAHCAALSLNASPEMMAATNTPVPAAESQLIAKRAPSGFAFTGATGGTRWTRLCSAGMFQPGKESVPSNAPPNSVVWNFTLEKRLLRKAFTGGEPHTPQQMIRIPQGTQA